MSEVYVRIEQRQVLARIEQAQPVAVLPIGLQGPRGEPGIDGARTGSGVAGASVSGGKAVKDINGTVTHYNPDTDEEPIGIALNGASIGQTVEYALSGNIVEVGGWGLTQNARYWFGTNGNLISTDNNTVKSQEAGVAISTGKLNFCPKEAIQMQ